MKEEKRGLVCASHTSTLGANKNKRWKVCRSMTVRLHLSLSLSLSPRFCALHSLLSLAVSRKRPRFVSNDDDGDDAVSCVYTRTTHRWFVEWVTTCLRRRRRWWWRRRIRLQPPFPARSFSADFPYRCSRVDSTRFYLSQMRDAYSICYVCNIAPLRQKWHNSKNMIFELLLWMSYVNAILSIINNELT